MPTQSLGFVSLAPRGEWDASTTYKRLDTVSYGGSSYIVLRTVTGIIPSNNNVDYTLLASKGDKGNKGCKGDDAFKVWSLQPGNEGKTYADYEAWLRQPATDAALEANNATAAAKVATENAKIITGEAQEATNNAIQATNNLENIKSDCITATDNANTAASEARISSNDARDKAEAAREATTKAQEATNNANKGTQEAKEAAQEAREAAQRANDEADVINNKLDKTGDGENVYVTFDEVAPRSNVASGDKLSVLFGKIKRWFSDLKTVAFTGKASDLSQDAGNRLVTDTEKAGWNDKYTRAEVDNKDAVGLQAAKEYAVQKIAELVNGSPAALDTLQELAAALGNDPNFATSIMALIGGKADTVHTHTKAQITDFPAALPANGGNADTVGGQPVLYLGRIVYPIADLDSNIGFYSGGFTPDAAGINPGTYGTILQVCNMPVSPVTEGAWVFQIAHAHGEARPMWRTQFNNKGWTAWKRLAFTDDLPTSLPASDVYAWAKQAVKPTYNINEIYDADSVWVPVGMVNRKVLVKNTKIGNGYTSSAAIGLTNPENRFGSIIVSAALNDEATSWADWTFDPATGRITNPSGKTFAYTDEVTGSDNFYPTKMNWTDGTIFGPRLELSGVGMNALSATIPAASRSVSGIVTTSTQEFAGTKTFNAGIDISAGGMTVNGGMTVTNGPIACTGEVSAALGFFVDSDKRLKKNIAEIKLNKRIKLYEFDLDGKHGYGVIAQEIEPLYPSAVIEKDNGYKAVNYTEILVIKCAEQDERIEALERENASLKERLERLEKLLLK